MKYPSQYLHAIADKIDELEDRVEGKLTDYDFDVWNWPRLRSEMQTLENQQKVFLNQYAAVVLAYEEETGKRWKPPHSIFSPYLYVLRMMEAAVERERKVEEAG